jgi:hypothetical protein
MKIPFKSFSGFMQISPGCRNDLFVEMQEILLHRLPMAGKQESVPARPRLTHSGFSMEITDYVRDWVNEEGLQLSKSIEKCGFLMSA